MHLFHLATFRIFSLFIVFLFLFFFFCFILICFGAEFFMFYVLLDCYYFPNLWPDLFHQVWNILSHLFKYCFLPIPFLLFLWSHKYTILVLITSPKFLLSVFHGLNLKILFRPIVHVTDSLFSCF